MGQQVKALRAVRIAPADTVAVLLEDGQAGDVVAAGSAQVELVEPIARGHKVALLAMEPGQSVIKYGTSIGRATAPVAAGAWVHEHNMATALTEEAAYEYHPNAKLLAGEVAGDAAAGDPAAGGPAPTTFKGFRRADGKVGIRNEIWIIPTVGCVNEIAAQVAHQAQDLVEGSLEGIYAFAHPYGCSQTGADLDQTARLLAALCHHPNAAGVLVLSLGCENLTPERFEEALGVFDPARIRFVCAQESADELTDARAALVDLAARAKQTQRQDIPASELVLGLKCGGSDGLSGITANPVIGRVADTVVAQGGTALLAEVPEMFGAEHFLLSRCRTRDAFDQAAAMLAGFKEYFTSHGETVYENPSPGNRAGGITTLEDKSCGCVQKGGTAPVEGALAYAQAPRSHGLWLVCSPGNDLVSTTALVAAGAHMVLFSTGRGTPFGAAVPTLKVATNSALAAKKASWVDFNAGVVAEGAPLDQTGAELWQLVLATASGALTSSERRGARGIALWKDGVTL